MSIKRFPSIFIVSTIVFLSIACSNAGSPITPSENQADELSQSFPISYAGENSNRSLLAVYDAVIDPVAKTFTITPDNRTAQYHYPLSLLYSNVLQIANFGWTPNFWADIKLTHPYPGSGITGYDPRVIAILPARTGVSMDYPTLDVHANNSVVLSPDGYTKLFDNLTSTPGNANPFKAYFTGQPYRRWSGTGVTEETKKWQMNLSGFGGPIRFQLVVDVSTNYPNPPQQIVDNIAEPYMFIAEVGEGLTEVGGEASIMVTCHDWQGRMSIGDVMVEAPDLFNGTINLAYAGPGPSQYEYLYTGTISNELIASAGEHKFLVGASDTASGVYVYREFSLEVMEIVDDGNLIWAKKAGGSSTDVGYGTATLSDNSFVLTGAFQSNATFGKGEINETILGSSGGSDIFIARFNPDGTLVWAKKAGGASGDSGYGVTTFPDDSIAVTGIFNGTATFGPGEPNQTILTEPTNQDLFVAKYNPNGTLIWAKNAGGTGFTRGCGITSLTDGTIVITGYFQYPSMFGAGDPNQTTLVPAGEYDAFIARYNANGTLAWAKRAGGVSTDYSYGVTSLSDNSVVMTGCFLSQTIVFAEDEPNEIVLWHYGDWDIFIAKYLPDGSFSWAKRAGSIEPDKGNAVTSLSDDSIVVSGSFMHVALFGENEENETELGDSFNSFYTDIFIARYSQYGTLTWAREAGSYYHDDCPAISSNQDDLLLITGFYSYDDKIGEHSGPITFGKGEENEVTLTPSDTDGHHEIYFACYYPDGHVAWAKSAGSVIADVGYCSSSLSDNSWICSGYFQSVATFGPEEPDETVLTSSGNKDIFLVRLKP